MPPPTGYANPSPPDFAHQALAALMAFFSLSPWQGRFYHSLKTLSRKKSTSANFLAGATRHAQTSLSALAGQILSL